MKTRRYKVVYFLAVMILLAGFIAGCGKTQPPVSQVPSGETLPERMTWTAYDVGASGYVQAGAIADAMTKEYGVRVRILPSGTSIGRITPVVMGTAAYGFLADETYFAVEGILDFSTNNWGPQDLRIILAKPATISPAVTKESGILTPNDFRGKRVAWIPGGDTLNVKMEAYLAFAGLTWADVVRVDMPSYAASLRGLIEGAVDVAIANPTAPIMYELDASPRGLFWPEFPASDTAGWARLQASAPNLAPALESKSVGITKPIEIGSYAYPQVTVRADRDADEVYAFIKAVDETFELFKDVDSQMSEWELGLASGFPAGAPYHKGAIRYLTEKGLWTPQHEAWNNAFLARMEKLKEAWEIVFEEATAKGVPEKEFPAYWLQRKAELVGN